MMTILKRMQNSGYGCRKKGESILMSSRRESNGNTFRNLLTNGMRMNYQVNFLRTTKPLGLTELQDKFYDGLTLSQIPKTDSTRYQWKFAKGIVRGFKQLVLNQSIRSKMRMDFVRDSVDSATNLYGTKSTSEHKSHSTRVIGPRLPSGGIGSGYEDAVDEEDLMRLKRQREKAENKMLRRRKESDLEELVPKETGRYVNFQYSNHLQRSHA
ncbi:hypothetical protein DSO57_1010211 [Entomophthora muscae]|uniref:Uncharacterized protein n=1 Tax=Entomophthora muscae TaxID=34485 RepID=A0ACC2RLD8_9FUNG|nr:hypothetical protein DSO57_1010211 [Entomophthora muscae]